MNSKEIEQCIRRISLQIVEEEPAPEGLALVGIQTRGVWLAQEIRNNIESFENISLPLGVLDTTLYRDDYRYSAAGSPARETDIPFNISRKNLILVDDILHTGRTIRAALDALMDMGRPGTVRLAVLVDRGQREIPIQPDYSGRIISTVARENTLRLFCSTVDKVETAVQILPREGQ
ncbi:bifunctional pyr operon transcriptional regulator/uracil phosphoribosyltransferase PyrR [Chitinivibrio alkaliphilus]|nr:bifunctional pyr operon transcriptional regulator/uracil phosphoribosyltransferase PyrR [Chitinivibrio alkaliphilus]